MHAHSSNQRSGSALLITLLVVTLLLVITLTMSVTVRMEMRSAIQRQLAAQAQSNAQLSLNLAIAKIQDVAGADKRVTGTAALVGATSQPHWTGVWASDPTDPTWTGVSGQPEDPIWLVSGAGTLDPKVVLDDDNSVVLVPSLSGSTEVRASPESMPVGDSDGQIAWWVGDEGVKARVDINLSDPSVSDTTLRKIRSETPSEPDMLQLGAPWNQGDAASIFAQNSSTKRERLISANSLNLSLTNIPADTLFHDLTVFGYGLPVNVKDGGFKADWSVVLDESMKDTPLVEHYLGASPTRSGANAAYSSSIYNFQTTDPDLFFLSSRIGTGLSNSNLRPGPNLGTLWNYGRLWKDAQSGQAPLTGLLPKVESDLRREDWLPYKADDDGDFSTDRQHTNSAIAPVLSHFRFGIRLVTEKVAGPPITYKVYLELKPLIGLWNPYNVAIQSEQYRFESVLSPMVRIRVTPPSGPSEEHISFMRKIWSGVAWAGSSERWLQLQTPPVDFQPGEIRLFSIDAVNNQSEKDKIDLVYLTSNWSSGGYILVDFLRSGGTGLSVPDGSTIEVLDVYLQDTQDPETHNTFSIANDWVMSWVTLKAKTNADVVLTRYTGFWNGGNANEAAPSGAFTIPEAFDASSTIPSLRVDAFDPSSGGSSEHLATWSFHLRTTDELENATQRTRGWIDSDPRAPVAVSYWDGDREYDSAAPDGYYFTSPFVGDGNENRGLVSSTEEEPSATSSRYQGYLGKSATDSNGGVTHLPLFDIPTSPLVSVGQFQHAQLGRYDYEPAFVAGNSYANVRIPLNKTVSTNHNGINDFELFDISYDVNQRVWDEIFFSTLAPDYVGGGSSWDSAFSGRLDNLPYPRMEYVNNSTSSPDEILSGAGTDGERGAEALAAHIRILGAFNFNSTSVTAWKAVLSTMAKSELPVINLTTGALSWESQDGIRFNRFSHVLSGNAYESGDINSEAFWQGWRKLSEQDLDDLAGAIVEEVKTRGPFRSFAEFVNRNPDSTDVALQRKGALQAALDKTVNLPGTGIGNTIGDTAHPPSGSRYDQNAFGGESAAVGYGSYLLQGDVLQSLAPILAPRSDTFTIRAYGSVGPEDAPNARAWCEAVVQRVAEYVDEDDEAWRNPVDDSLKALNNRFGRQFEIVSFRWLEPNEVEDSL